MAGNRETQVPQKLKECSVETPATHSPVPLTRFSEKLLMALCRDPRGPEAPGATVLVTVENALDFLELTVPNFRSFVRGNVVRFLAGALRADRARHRHGDRNFKAYMTKGLPLSGIPVLRELCASAAACVLTKR